MVERRLVGPKGQRPTLTDGARPSKSVASSHESRAGNARDRKSRGERKGEMGARDNGKKRKQHLTRCLPLSHHNNPGSSGSSSSSAAAVTEEVNTGVLKLKGAVTEDELLLPVANVKDFALVQLCKLQSFGEGSPQEHQSLLLGLRFGAAVQVANFNWRRVFTGAGFAALGRHSFVIVFGDCRCHDEVHRTKHYFSHEEGTDVHDVPCQPAGCPHPGLQKENVRWLRTTIRLGSSISIGFRQRHVACLLRFEVTFDIDAHRNRFANELGGGTV